MPILEWLPAYDKSWFRWDVVAALTVWALLVPEAMAYAGIAGMPPQTGLYTAPLALVGYAIFGTSRHLNVGPSSTVAILSFAIIGAIATGSKEFVVFTTGLALMTGVLLILSGLLRLGVLADFLSKPVLSGFIVGLAITIAFGQLGKIVGYDVEAAGFFREVLQFVFDIRKLHIPTLIVGVGSLAALFLLHAYAPKIPAAITVLILAIIVSAALNLNKAYGVHIVGEIPAGLPPFGLPDISVRDYMKLIPGAVAVALVGFAESVAAARSYATRFGYEVDANQEMVGLGVANLGAGVSGGFVVDGSLSKTAASVGAGARSQMVSIIAAIFIIITVLFLTPLFYSLPEATLGAIVIHAVWKLISFHKLKRYWIVRRGDFWASLVALVGVLVLGLLGGLLLAVVLSLLTLLASVKNPHAAILGKLPGRTAYRSLENFPDAETFPGLLIFRFDALLFFANAPNFRDLVRVALNMTPDTKVLLVDADPINYVDVTAIDMLEELHNELKEQGVELWFSGVMKDVFDTMDRAGLVERIGREHFFTSIQVAVEHYLTPSSESIHY
ncbi:MAG: sulfate permease [Chloroflexi bacterium]|nr:sulfate permease [Chloroflexota bacterium]